MQEIAMLLKNWVVLSLSELLHIRSQVYSEDKNKEKSSKERVNLFAQTIHKMLDSHLEGLSTDEKQLIRSYLISKTLSNPTSSVTRYDIFESIFNLEIAPEKQLTLAKEWLSETAQVSIKSEEIASFLGFYDLSTTYSNPKTPHWNYRSLGLIIGLMAIFLMVFSLYSAPKTLTEESPTFNVLYQTRLHARSFSDIPMINKFHQDSQGIVYINHNQLYPLIRLNARPFPYRSFDYFKLKNYLLLERAGYIGEPANYNTIVRLAYAKNTDPLLLFAIIGHEQAFVPINHDLRERIINNPYNVFGTWEKYNTNLEDATKIAINTISKRLESLPVNTDPFLWLNGTYAEDPNWHKGVRLIYEKLDNIASVKPK